MSRSTAFRRCTPPVLALFLAISVTPRAVLYAHHHASGDHDHVHVWGEDAFEHHHHDDDHDHDHDAVAPHHHHDHPDTGEVELEAPDGDHGTHAHVQVPFQLALHPPATILAAHLLVRPIAPVVRVAAGVTPVPATLARGPPSSPFA